MSERALFLTGMACLVLAVMFIFASAVLLCVWMFACVPVLGLIAGVCWGNALFA